MPLLTSVQVWLESVPAQYITQLDVAADMHGLGKLVANHFLDTHCRKILTSRSERDCPHQRQFQGQCPNRRH